MIVDGYNAAASDLHEPRPRNGIRAMMKYVVELIGTFFLVLTIGNCVLRRTMRATWPRWRSARR